MKTIKGEYENGRITLLEEVPSFKKNKVLVTFLDEEENEDEAVRNYSLQTSASLAEYLEDEREDLYQEFLNNEK